jgi:hypothetical protein
MKFLKFRGLTILLFARLVFFAWGSGAGSVSGNIKVSSTITDLIIME